MNEPTKTRFTIDLDEVDRQLRKAAATPAAAPRREGDEPVFKGAAPDAAQGYSGGRLPARMIPVTPVPPVPPAGQVPPAAPVPPAPPASAPGGDSLRELARIVGQNDPFRSILGNPAAGQRQVPPPPPPLAPQPLAPQPGRGAAQGLDGRSSAGAPGIAAQGLGRSPEVGKLADHLRYDGVRDQNVQVPSSQMPSSQAPSSYDDEPPSYARPQMPGADDFESLKNLAEQMKSPAAPQAYAPAQAYAPYQASPPVDTGYTPPQSPSSRLPESSRDPFGDRAYEQDFEDYAPSYANPNLGYQPGYQQEEDGTERAEPSSRKKWLLIGTLAVVVVGASAGGYGLMKKRGIVGSGEPPVVAASTGPTKVVPSEPDGKEFPDQNKQIYQSGAKEVRTQVVNREEQPLDIRQATGVNGKALANDDGLGEARRVRTVTVTVSGQILGEGGNAPSLPPGVSASAQQPPLFPVQSTASSPSGAGMAPSSQDQSPVQPRPRVALPAATTPAATPSTLPQRTAAAAAPPENTAAAAPETHAAAPQATGGHYTVQFGTASTEAEAKSKFAAMKARYKSVMSGATAGIHSGTNSHGATIYRIRSAGMSKEAADALCHSLKTAASSDQVCFVARH